MREDSERKMRRRGKITKGRSSKSKKGEVGAKQIGEVEV